MVRQRSSIFFSNKDGFAFHQNGRQTDWQKNWHRLNFLSGNFFYKSGSLKLKIFRQRWSGHFTKWHDKDGGTKWPIKDGGQNFWPTSWPHKMADKDGRFQKLWPTMAENDGRLKKWPTKMASRNGRQRWRQRWRLKMADKDGGTKMVNF